MGQSKLVGGAKSAKRHFSGRCSYISEFIMMIREIVVYLEQMYDKFPVIFACKTLIQAFIELRPDYWPNFLY